FLKPVHSKCSKKVNRNSSADSSGLTVFCGQLAGVPGLPSSAGTVGEFVVHSLPAFSDGTPRKNGTVPIIRCWNAQPRERITCPTSPPGVGLADAWCTSVPIRVKYTFYYNISGEILMLYVDAELSDVPEVYYQETFVDFLQGITGSVVTMDLTNTAESVFGQANLTYRYTGGVWNVPAGGPCIPDLDLNSVVDYEPLRFGQDTFTGCTISLSTADFQDPVSEITDWAAQCDFFQTRLWHSLNYPTSGSLRFMGLQPEYLASWPAAKTNQSGDWVPIQNPLLSSGLAKPNGRTG
ncbi:hypothetical protein FBUS_07296, partial [Fasciolopsis buskii]